MSSKDSMVYKGAIDNTYELIKCEICGGKPDRLILNKWICIDCAKAK